ncbi:MAG: rRNA maturation RNase YbeY [Bdellovibrionaceae bacterium]|nr:rRNA maturation RNase YbeY [Pseudobdellovibrionaceae bacterium]
MEITITNLQHQYRVPQAFILTWVPQCIKAIQKKKLRPHFSSMLKKDLSIVFVDAKTIKKLNKQYRGKNKATDILSFSDLFEEQLGELVLCPEVIVAQAQKQKWSQRHEYGYMVLHGILHLLGYDHEVDLEAQEMFKLQDSLFAALMP